MHIIRRVSEKLARFVAQFPTCLKLNASLFKIKNSSDTERVDRNVVIKIGSETAT